MGTSHRKGKAFEKATGKLMLKVDGPCPKWGGLTTETARTGQLSDLQVDVLTKSYAIECKSGSHVPTTPFKWFEQILERAEEHEKQAFLAMKVDGRKFRKANILHCITPERHAELLKKERRLENERN